MTDEEFEALACHQITKIKVFWYGSLDYKRNSVSKAIDLEIAIDLRDSFEQWLKENINP